MTCKVMNIKEEKKAQLMYTHQQRHWAPVPQARRSVGD